MTVQAQGRIDIDASVGGVDSVKAASGSLDHLVSIAEQTAITLARIEVSTRRASGGLDSVDSASRRAESGLKLLWSELNQGIEVAQKAASAFEKVVSGFDQAIERGEKFRLLSLNMQQLGFSIESARAATRGLIDDFTLTQTAARAAAFKVAKNSEEFANLAKAATIAGQKVGVDTVEALDRLITGISRGSTAILDDLTIRVKAEDAYRSYAKSIGKTTAALTAEQKATAFAIEAKRQLAAFTKGAKVEADSAGGSWKQLKVQMQNISDEMKTAIASSDFLKKAFQGQVQVMRLLNTTTRNLRTEQKLLNEERAKTLAQYKLFMKATAPEPSDVQLTDKDFAAQVAGSAKFASKALTPGSKEAKAAAKKAFDEQATLMLEPSAAERTAADKQELLVIQARTKARIEENKARMDAFDLGEKLANQQAIEAEAKEKARRKSELITAQLQEENKKKREQAKFNAEMNASLKGLIDGAMSGFANATGQMIQAVVEGKKSIGEGILGITKAVITGAGIQAMVLGALEMAKALAAIAGIFTAPLAAGHFAAGAAFFGVGALVTGLGAAIPSGAAAGGGNASRSTRAAGGASTFRPRTTGDRRGGDGQRTTVVNLEIHGGRPIAGAFWREQLEAQLRGAA